MSSSSDLKVTGHVQIVETPAEVCGHVDDLHDKGSLKRVVSVAQTNDNNFQVFGSDSAEATAEMLLMAAHILAAVPHGLRDKPGTAGKVSITKEPKRAQHAVAAGRGLRTIAVHWAKMESIVFPNLSKEDRVTARRTFYCGAVTMFELIAGSMTSDDEPTEEEMGFLDALRAEMDAFREECVRDGWSQPPKPAGEV